MAVNRVLIVFDGHRWHVRGVRVIEHDLEHDEKVYRCDRVIANDLHSIEAAVDAMRADALRWSKWWELFK